MLPYLTCTPPKHPEISVQSGVEIEKFTGSVVSGQWSVVSGQWLVVSG
jgi:hypothetical protein